MSHVSMVVPTKDSVQHGGRMASPLYHEQVVDRLEKSGDARAIHMVQVNNAAFGCFLPEVYTRETRLVFRDGITSGLIVLTHREWLKKPTPESTMNQLVYDNLWQQAMWMPFETGCSPHFDTAELGAFLRWPDTQLLGMGIEVSPDSVQKLSVSWKHRVPHVRLSSEILAKLVRLSLRTLRPLSVPKFGDVFITGLAPDRALWSDAAQRFFWSEFPLSELMNISTSLRGADMMNFVFS